MQRRLAAILAADVVGYTRLMGRDEAGTLGRLTTLRQQILEPLIAEHHGRIVKLIGDGLLVEFASVVDATGCALAWQEGVARHEADGEPGTRLVFRIGINLGDVIVENGDIHGDGVNIAARLESLAEPGGIYLSEDAYRQARGKLSVAFQDLGERELKNVAEPVRIYRITSGEAHEAPEPPLEGAPKPPDQPSVAVLPFVNMSGDPTQDAFADSVTEDITTELSRFRDLFVAARNSAFAYKGKATKVQDIATDLGVRYVLEGSLRQAGERLRVTAQLIDAESGHHIWSEAYTREIADLFALQDEIVHRIAATVAGRVKVLTEAGVEAQTEEKPSGQLTAYDYLLRGQSIVANTKENNLRARQAYKNAIALDPSCARAYVGLALSYEIEWFNHWGDAAIARSGAPPDEALAHAAKAVSLDPTDSKAQLMLGHIYSERAEYAQGEAHLDRALALNPNDPDVLAYRGVHFEKTGRIDEAITSYEQAIALNPFHPVWYLWKLGRAYYVVRRYEDALIPLREALSRSPKFKRARVTLLATYGQIGRLEEAASQLRQLLADHPEASLKQESQWAYMSEEERGHWLEGLRKAGFPE